MLLCFLVCFATPVMAVDCDPVVSLNQQTGTLQKTLSVLAKRYQFELNFPMNADQSVDSVDGMRLSQALKYLTSDVNTVLQHEKVEGCTLPRLVSMEVLPVGEEGEYVHVTPNEAASAAVEEEPVYIENMERYAEEVLLKQRKRDVNLTPEQKQEFRKIKKEVQQRLEAEGLLEPKKSRKKDKIRDRKKPGKKNQQEQVDQSL